MSVVGAVRRDLERLGDEASGSALAATALALAAELDDAENSATSKSMCARALNETMASLRELAPPKPTADRIDEVKEKREDRRSRRVAGA